MWRTSLRGTDATSWCALEPFLLSLLPLVIENKAVTDSTAAHAEEGTATTRCLQHIVVSKIMHGTCQETICTSKLEGTGHKQDECTNPASLEEMHLIEAGNKDSFSAPAPGPQMAASHKMAPFSTPEVNLAKVGTLCGNVWSQSSE